MIDEGTEPVFAGYCHCRDCRQAHAAPIYQYVYLDKNRFCIVNGSELLKWYTREESRRPEFRRFFCERCGSKVYNELFSSGKNPELTLCGTFPALFDDEEIATSETWSPKKHIHCQESIMDLTKIHDSLPRVQTG